MLKNNFGLFPKPQPALSCRWPVITALSSILSCDVAAPTRSRTATAANPSSNCQSLPNRRQACSSLSSAVLLLGLHTQPVQAGLIDEQQADNVFSIAGQSVVSIADYKVSGGQEEAEGTGSGFLWDTFGHVVTNYHVVAAAKQSGVLSDNQVCGCCLCLLYENRVPQAAFTYPLAGRCCLHTVTILARQHCLHTVDVCSKLILQLLLQVVRVGFVNDKGTTEEFPATIVGTDAQHDIAVLLINAPQKTFVPVQVGASAGLRTGQSVYAIGNPYGLSRTLTAGVVSGLNRAIPSPVGTKTYGAIQVMRLVSCQS